MMTPELARRVVGIIAGENLAQGRAPAAPELVFSDVLWPDFSKDDRAAALEEFDARERRFGAR